MGGRRKRRKESRHGRGRDVAKGAGESVQEGISRLQGVRRCPSPRARGSVRDPRAELHHSGEGEIPLQLRAEDHPEIRKVPRSRPPLLGPLRGAGDHLDPGGIRPRLPVHPGELPHRRGEQRGREGPPQDRGIRVPVGALHRAGPLEKTAGCRPAPGDRRAEGRDPGADVPPARLVGHGPRPFLQERVQGAQDPGAGHGEGRRPSGGSRPRVRARAGKPGCFRDELRRPHLPRGTAGGDGASDRRPGKRAGGGEQTRRSPPRGAAFPGPRGKAGTPALLLELGHALCRANRGWIRGRKVDVKKARKYRKGQALLEKVGRPDEIGQDCAAHPSMERDETRARALYTLAWSYENVPGEELKARELYHKAYCCDPMNSYHLASFIEFEIFCNKDRSFVPMLRPALLKAIDACRAHADAGIELPWAFLTMGRFLLLLGHPYESLSAYAKGIHLCLSGKVCAPDDVLDAETDFLRRINFGRKYPQPEQWVADFLLLAKALKPSGVSALEEIREKAPRKKPFLHPVVIVAGGAHADFQNEMEGYKGLLEGTFDRFSGTIISGGTTAGIPGIVGGLAQRLTDGRGIHVAVIGYLPRALPKHVQMDRRYHELIDTEGDDFSPHQPLMNWFDLVAAGVKPSDVSVLGINGGRIAAFEYRLALALGAKVGIVEASGRAASELLPDADWWNVSGFVVLPW